MRFSSGPLEGIRLIDSEAHADARGYFARVFCEREFGAGGLPQRFPQSSISYNRLRGTLRGLHFQWPPSHEGKLVRCVAGTVFDVMVDLRPQSPTFGRHLTVELSAENARAVFIPHGFAHGFQTLTDGATVLYQMDESYVANLDGGFRYDDPSFGIAWPEPVTMISDRDRLAAAFDRDAFHAEYRSRAATDAGVGRP